MDRRHALKPYIIDTDKPTEGPWRVTSFGNRYASVTMEDGRKFFVGVEKDKPVRIPFKPRGQNRGWRYYGFVRESVTGTLFLSASVGGSIGVRGLLRAAGLITSRLDKSTE
jgi:hypothetical protein